MTAGRPSKYNKQTAKKVSKLAKAGARDVDIAKNLGITTVTLNNWKKKYPELFNTLKAGKDEVDKSVVCALLKNALGYTVTETKRFYKPLFASNGDPVIGNDDKQVKALLREEITEKEIAPATIAQIFWLKNRQPEKWRQNPQFSNFNDAKGEILELFNRMEQEGREAPA